jgi:hypothetical protein
MKFDPEKSLFDLNVVRWIAGITLAFSLLSTIAIIENSDLYFSFKAENFEFAVKNFQVPLGILAVGLSIIGILGANHRSEQTKRQIERTALQIQLTQSQNNFSNYYKHLEEFEKFCKAHVDDTIYTINRPRRLHSEIFAFSGQGDYSIHTEFLEKLDVEAEYFNAQVNSMAIKSNRLSAMRAINEQESIFLTVYYLGAKSRTGSEWRPVTGDPVFIPGKNLKEFVVFHKKRFDLINEILKFNATYTPSEILKRTIELKTAKINPSTFIIDAELYLQD